jgi:mono/diheme cytochrome c family protein
MMLERLACRRCHSWGGKGGRLASDLDSVYYTKPVEVLAEALSRPVAQMPDFALDEGQVEAVVSALLKTSQGGAEAEAESQAPVVIHFNLERSEQDHPFDVRCGSCHRLLTNRFGALGRGDVAPNLSGLLDGYFPELEDGRPWTVGLLRKWLGNPRRLRKNALMQPVLLKEEELSKILEVFFDTDDECASHVISSGMKN